MLQVKQLHAFYGKSHVLHGVDLQVQAGEIVALLGRNGAGRSTLAKAIMGLCDWQGQLQFQNQSLAGLSTFEIAQRGIGYVPESRDVFPQLTVEQNLLLGIKPRAHAPVQPYWSWDDVHAFFPRLEERWHTRAGVLSGGEQQMLTLCRSLMGNPQLLLVDEPTEGLAPQVVEQVAACLDQVRQRGVSVLLLEQKLHIALRVSQRVLVMGQGQMVFEGTPQALQNNAAVRKEWLEV